MIKRNKTHMQSLMEDLNKASRILRKGNRLFEDYGMQPEEEDPRMAQQQGEEGMMNQEQPMQGQDEMMGQEEEMQPQVSEQTVDTINQIRELAIQGIAQYANDVESEQYKALKRIWLETDKFYETINGDKDKK